MFPSMSQSDIYNIYHLKCNDSIPETVQYLTQNQPANFVDEVPIDVLIESLNNAQIASISSSASNLGKKDYFAQTPTHILSHIFTFNGPMCLGKVTRLNRECRLLARGLLSRITQFDFSFYYHHFCQFKSSKRNKKNIQIIHNDELKLISHINAFPLLESLSLRSTHFTKWNYFRSLVNKRNITYLNLSSSLNLYDDDIALILETFSCLNTLDLSKCFEITDLAIINIIEYENTNCLHTLYLNHMPQISKNGIKQLMKYKKSVTHLEWKGAKYGNLVGCFDAAKHVKYLNLSSNNNLEQLSLSLSHTQNDSLDLILSNCAKLRFVDLNIAHLTSLHLTQCLKLREVRISHAANLREINCKSCKLLELLAIPSKQVQIVQISGCNSLNLELLFNESNFLMQSMLSESLVSLDLSQMSHVEDDDVDRVLEMNMAHGSVLRAFSVCECRLVSKTTVNDVRKSFKKPTTKSMRTEKRKKRIMDRKSRRYSS